MTQNFPRKMNVRTNVNYRTPIQPQPRHLSEEMLNEIAFVLKMTQRVRNEIEADQEVVEAATV